MTDIRTLHTGRRTAFQKTLVTTDYIPTSPCTFECIATEEIVTEYHDDYGTSAPTDFLNDWWQYEHEYD